MGLGSTRQTVLVTGAAGFLGSHLVDRLLADGFEVVGLDNLMTGDLGNLEAAGRDPHFHLEIGDVRETLHVYAQVIYNMACPASPVHYQSDPYATATSSILGALRLVEHARAHKCRIVHASTSEVYGDPLEHPQREEYWGHVNPIGERACYDAETEILTEDGWVRFPELRRDAKVATLRADGVVEYHVPDEHIAYPYVGELLHFQNEKLDLCVTPNHRMYVRSKTGKLRFLRADEIAYAKSWRVPTGAKFEGEEVEYFDLGERPRNAKVHVARTRMDDWLEFFGYYVSEGCVHVRRRVREVGGRDYDIADYNVLIAQNDGPSRDKMIACLARLGFKYFTSDDHQLCICSKQLAEILQPLGKSGDTFLPRQYLRLSRRQSKILFDALVLGDGTWKGGGGVYYSKSRRLAEDVQELALRCGYAASVTLTPGRDLWRTNFRPPVEATLVPPVRRRYAGNVYCVDVKNHVVCVRRNGRAAFCGNCYDEGKRAAETLLMDARRTYAADARIVRIFNTYGPRMAFNDGRVVSNFIVQAISREPITLYGDGKQTRAFCYVSDLVEGLVRAARVDVFDPPVNLGNPKEFTMHELADVVRKVAGEAVEIKYAPLPADDPKRRCPNIEKAKRLLGFSTSVDLEEGIRKTYENFKSRMAAKKR